MYVAPKTIKDVDGPNDSPGATVSLKEVLRTDFKRKEVANYIASKREIIVVINGDGASYPVLRKSRRNMLQVSATTSSLPNQDGQSLTHRTLSVNCVNVLSAYYAKENRPSMLRAFGHCKDEIEEISNAGEFDGVPSRICISGDCKWIRNVLGLQSHVCFYCKDLPTTNAKKYSSFCDFRQKLGSRRTFLSMQENGEANIKALRKIYRKKKADAEKQSSEPLNEKQLEYVMKLSIASSAYKEHLRTTNQNYAPMIRSSKEILIALDPLHLLLRQFDVFEQKIIYPILKKENIDENEYQMQIWLHGIERRKPGISGEAALIWMRNIEDMVSCLPEKYQFDIIDSVKTFLRIYDIFNSPEYATDAVCKEFRALCWKYGKDLNDRFPQTMWSRSLYLHMIKHLPDLLEEFRSGVIGSCHAGEFINCVLGRTRERHARSGGPMSDLLRYLYRHTSEELANLIPAPKEYAQRLCRICDKPGRFGSGIHKACKERVSSLSKEDVSSIDFSVQSTFSDPNVSVEPIDIDTEAEQFSYLAARNVFGFNDTEYWDACRIHGFDE